MEKMLRRAVAGLLLALVVGTLADKNLWLPGRELAYRYEASLGAGTAVPGVTISRWNISGRVVVQGGDHLATLQLQDLKVSSYNGPRIHDTPVVETPIPGQASQLQQPFIIHYNADQVVGLSVKAGEEEWAINMKRGLASLLQLDLPHLQEPAFFTTENSQYGCCNVEYSVQSNGTLVVRKFVDFSSCEGFPVHGWRNVQKVPCLSQTSQEAVSSGSVRAYVLEPSGPGGHLGILSVQADGVMHLQLPRGQEESYFLTSWVSLHLQEEGEVKTPLIVEGGGVRVGLIHVLPDADVSQGRSPPSQKDLLAAVSKILDDLVDNLEVHDLETDPVKLHEEWVAHALYFLSLLDQTSLKHLYEDFEVGTSYRHETLGNLFLELLPLVGSRDSILLVRDLLMGGVLKNDTAEQLVSAFPFNVRKPSEQLLVDMEVLLQLPEDTPVHSAAVLSFATLVHRVCSHSCAPETLEKYMGHYLDLFTGSQNHGRQMLYLEALSNLELQRITEFLAPIIRGEDPRYSRHIRFLAVWATQSHASQQPKEMYRLYWPLLTNRSEHLEMRVAALTMLVLSQPTLARFYNLFMLREENPHLRHFWYTTLRSLEHTKWPCYRHMRDVARNLAGLVAEADKGHWATSNYILDYADPDHRFGSLAQLLTVANPRTGLPTVFYLNVGSHAMDFSYDQFSVYVKLEGFGDEVKRLLLQTRALNVKQLVELLQQLEVPSETLVPVHFELVVKLQNKVVLVRHLNQAAIKSMYKNLVSVQQLAMSGIHSGLHAGVHVNGQDVMVPFLAEEMRPTDLGTNALLRVSSAWLMSQRANVTIGNELGIGQDLRSFLSSQMALTLYNPVINMWHGVQRSINVQAIVQFNLKTFIDPKEKMVKFTVLQTPGDEIGIVAHAHTSVFVRGIAAATKLKSHCANCSAHVFVTTRNKLRPLQEQLLCLDLIDSRIDLAPLDCEYSYDGDELEALINHMTAQQNYHVFPASSPLLTSMQMLDYLLLPPTGSCGLFARVKPTVTQPTELVVTIRGHQTELPYTTSLEPPAAQYSLHVDMVQTPASNALSNWNLSIVYHHQSGLLENRLTAELIIHDGHKVCVDLTAKFPETSVTVASLSDPGNQSFTAALNAAWGVPTDETQCSFPSNLHVTLDGRLSAEQRVLASEASTWPYDACRKDLQDVNQWGSHYAPLTRACYIVAQELKTLRHYIISISPTSLPAWTDAALQEKLPSWLVPLLSNKITIDLEVPPVARPTLTFNGYKKMSLGSDTGAELQYFLFGTKLWSRPQLGTSEWTLGSCLLTSSSVWTMDGANITTDIPTCYTLAMADTISDPHFALLIRKVEGATFPLAVKLYTGDSHVEVLPTVGQLIISVDDEVVSNPQKGYRQPAGSNIKLKVRQLEDGRVHIHLVKPKVDLYYYGHFVTATVPSFYRGYMYGLCGNNNGDSGDDRSRVFKLPCPGV